MQSAGVPINTIQACIGAALAAIVMTSGAGCQQTTAQRNPVTRLNARPSTPLHHPSADSPPIGTWRTCKPINQGAVFAGTVVLPDGRIFVISGRTIEHGKRTLTDAVRVYDPIQQTWTQVAPIPTPRTEPAAAVGSDGKIYVMGGADREHKNNVVEAYDPRKDRWVTLRSMPTPREALWAAVAKGADGRVRIYAIGGRVLLQPGNGLRTVEAYDPSTDTWIARAPMPTHRHALTATLGPDGRIYAMGGSNDTVFCTDAVEIYDPVKNAWTQGTPLPYGRECAAAAFTSGPNGEVFVFAGWDRRSWPLQSTLAYSPRTRGWRFLPPLPSARAAVGAVTIAGADRTLHLYVLGGIPHETAVEEYSFHPLPGNR